MSEIRLKDPEDEEMKSCLKNVMEQLALEEDSDVLEVVNREGAHVKRGFPLTEHVLISQKGYEIRDNVNGPCCAIRLCQKTQHGYSENFKGMRASFMLEGEDIQAGDDLGAMSLIGTAPILAALMSFELPDAGGTYMLKQIRDAYEDSGRSAW